MNDGRHVLDDDHRYLGGNGYGWNCQIELVSYVVSSSVVVQVGVSLAWRSCQEEVDGAREVRESRVGEAGLLARRPGGIACPTVNPVVDEARDRRAGRVFGSVVVFVDAKGLGIVVGGECTVELVSEFTAGLLDALGKPTGS
jgi:hypothetical protein